MMNRTAVAGLAIACVLSASAVSYAVDTSQKSTVKVRVSQASDDLEEWIAPAAGQTQSKTAGTVDVGSSDLEIGCEGGSEADPQIVGVRFPGVPVGPSRTISRAFIVFELDATPKNTDPFSQVIRAEDSDNPLTFANVAGELSSRPKSADSVVWTLAAGAFNVVNARQSTADITALVQQLVNRSGWASANAMAFYLRGTGTRETESYDGEAGAAPELVIEYVMTVEDSVAYAALPRNTVEKRVATADDDLEEWLTGTSVGQVDNGSSDLELGSESAGNASPQIVGVRFPGIRVQPGRIITRAYIEFEEDAVAKNTDPCVLTIRAETSANPAPFALVNNSLSGRTKTADSITWTIPVGTLAAVDEKGRTSDITPLVQLYVDNAGWVAGNAMAFYITGTGTREVESYDGEPGAAPLLHIEYLKMPGDTLLVDRRVDSVMALANALVDTNYTVPSWTLLLRAKTSVAQNGDSVSVDGLISAMGALEDRRTPYCVTTTINGNPTDGMAFNWFTNAGNSTGTVEIVEGNVTAHTAFATPLKSVVATSLPWSNVNYTSSNNGLFSLTGIPDNAKRNYVVHKAIATGLSANTQYSYRVGKDSGWSQIGHFTTGVNSGTPFSFVYFTDPQANTDEMFAISAKTMHTAMATSTDAKFILSCGDLVETSGASNSEWEYEQFFRTQQDIWYKYPFAPVLGNHDVSANRNFTQHFNTPVTPFDSAISTTPGSVYSFVYGNALFLAMSYENYSTAGYLDSLRGWVRAQVAANPTATWRIAYYHKAVYTGSRSHQSDADAIVVRNAMAPLFDSLGIHVAMQGHDHVYEVIGPVNNKALVSGAVSGQTMVTPDARTNVTGKLGGHYNVLGGTLYFLNNSAGKKKYEPRSETEMDAAETALGVTDYFGLFTGRFGQTGEPTFSNITVHADSIEFSTYTVSDAGVATLFDAFTVVRQTPVLAGMPMVTVVPRLTASFEKSGALLVRGNVKNRAITVELKDAAGRLVARTSSRDAFVSLPTRHLSSGMYFVSISGQDLLKQFKLVRR